MAEIYCKYCGKKIGPEPHEIGGPECSTYPIGKKLPDNGKKWDKNDLVRKGIKYKKTLD